jgi:Carboxypeptidase regulatory-like domain/TonB-dependent Receptor Plug Domain
MLWCALVLLLAALPTAAACQVVLTGEVVEAGTSRAVSDASITLIPANQQTTTDDAGRFRFDGVAPGSYTLRVRHLAFGDLNSEVVVAGPGPVRVRLTVSAAAIELERVDVEVLSASQLAARGAGFRRNVVTREQIAAAENSMMSLEDVLRQYVPSVRVRRVERIVGTPVCIELRTIRVIGGAGQCLSPAVYLDGVPITNPTTLYATLDPRMVESMEVIPAAESGVRFGSGALYGALLIETIRPGGARAEELVRRPPNCDWSTETGQHPTARVFVSSLLGNLSGAGIGLLAARQCLRLRAPSYDSVITDCNALPTVGVAAAAILLPALGGGFVSGFAGRTDMSEGRLIPATAAATMALIPGYALVLSSRRNDSDGLRIVGYALIGIGAPMMATAADYLFRKLRSRD